MYVKEIRWSHNDYLSIYIWYLYDYIYIICSTHWNGCWIPIEMHLIPWAVINIVFIHTSRKVAWSLIQILRISWYNCLAPYNMIFISRVFLLYGLSLCKMFSIQSINEMNYCVQRYRGHIFKLLNINKYIAIVLLKKCHLNDKDEKKKYNW